MPVTLDTFNAASLEPVEFPEHAFTEAITLGASLTLTKGTVLAKRTSDNKHYAYDNNKTDGTGVATCILKFDVVTDASGNHYLGTNAVASHFNLPQKSTTAYVAGVFDTDELTGWDSNAATDFHARTLPSGWVSIPL